MDPPDFEELHFMTNKFSTPSEISNTAREAVINGFEETNASLKMQLSRREMENRELKTLFYDMESELHELRAKTAILKNIENDLERVEQEKRGIESENFMLKHALAANEEQDKINEKLLATDIAQQDIVSLQETLLLREKALRVAQEESQSMLQQLDALQRNQVETNKYVELLIKHNENLEAINQELQTSREIIHDQVEQTASVLAAHQQREFELRNVLKKLTKDNKDLQQRLKDVESSRQQLLTQASALKGTFQEARDKLEEYEVGKKIPKVVGSKLKNLKEENMTLKEKISQDRERMEFLKQEVMNYTCNLQEQAQVKSKLERDLEYYQMNYVEQNKVEQIVKDMELKYKMDLHTQIQHLNNIYSQKESLE